MLVGTVGVWSGSGAHLECPVHEYGRSCALLTKRTRGDVPVTDRFALAPPSESECRNFQAMCHGRYLLRSTVPLPQLSTYRWHEPAGDPTVADSILDRVVHSALILGDARTEE